MENERRNKVLNHNTRWQAFRERRTAAIILYIEVKQKERLAKIIISMLKLREILNAYKQ